MLEGSDEGEVNALSITRYFQLLFSLTLNQLKFNCREGEHFVSGGEDKLVKLWGYDEGINYCTGTGHSGAITRVRRFISLSFDVSNFKEWNC